MPSGWLIDQPVNILTFYEIHLNERFAENDKLKSNGKGLILIH